MILRNFKIYVNRYLKLQQYVRAFDADISLGFTGWPSDALCDYGGA